MLSIKVQSLWILPKSKPPPKSIKEHQRFLGLLGYYRRFIKNYGVLARPLTTLLKKDNVWHWNDKTRTTFEQLKQAIFQALVLAMPNFKEQF
ncbi:polyprotein [Gossypium australe]|uniref:Polyprotein n=1 Tax=Gossypium australe TaxID=47621 RepID=A0A5B6VTT1_9ROSI|nr:polyprotein [Gossypium australe]